MLEVLPPMNVYDGLDVGKVHIRMPCFSIIQWLSKRETKLKLKWKKKICVKYTSREAVLPSLVGWMVRRIHVEFNFSPRIEQLWSLSLGYCLVVWFCQYKSKSALCGCPLPITSRTLNCFWWRSIVYHISPINVLGLLCSAVIYS